MKAQEEDFDQEYRDIVAEFGVLDMQPLGIDILKDRYCVLCGGYKSILSDQADHEPTCLWLRAKNLMEQRTKENRELSDVLTDIMNDPCAECGQPLGKNWTERYNAQTSRLDKVHIPCDRKGEKDA